MSDITSTEENYLVPNTSKKFLELMHGWRFNTSGMGYVTIEEMQERLGKQVEMVQSSYRKYSDLVDAISKVLRDLADACVIDNNHHNFLLPLQKYWESGDLKYPFTETYKIRVDMTREWTATMVVSAPAYMSKNEVYEGVQSALQDENGDLDNMSYELYNGTEIQDIHAGHDSFSAEVYHA